LFAKPVAISITTNQPLTLHKFQSPLNVLMITAPNPSGNGIKRAEGLLLEMSLNFDLNGSIWTDGCHDAIAASPSKVVIAAAIARPLFSAHSQLLTACVRPNSCLIPCALQ
jgi:hypothetical protein